MNTNTWLENGTNELEVLEFTLNGSSYGVDVANIREIILYRDVTPVPNVHPSIEGIFMPRDTMMIAVDLRNFLQKGEPMKGGLFIAANLNRLNIAFHVDSVFGILRVSRSKIINPTPDISNVRDGISRGIIKSDDKLINILDFEKIVSEINPETTLKTTDLNTIETRDRANVPIVIAEDSPLLMMIIVKELRKSGYDNLILTESGQEAWDIILDCAEYKTSDEHVKCVITDIEIPQMDGHRLTKLIKSDDRFKNISVVIFSSLINEVMEAKGKSLGADAQLSKPEIGSLAQVIDKLVL